MKASSSMGSGSGAVQSVSANKFKRPVMTAKVPSVVQRAHQTRYLISLEASETLLLSFRKLRPSVEAWRIAIPLTAQDLCDISLGSYRLR